MNKMARVTKKSAIKAARIVVKREEDMRKEYFRKRITKFWRMFNPVEMFAGFIIYGKTIEVSVDENREIKVYNNRITPHLLNYPRFWHGDISDMLFTVKIGDLVIEFWNYTNVEKK